MFSIFFKISHKFRLKLDHLTVVGKKTLKYSITTKHHVFINYWFSQKNYLEY